MKFTAYTFLLCLLSLVIGQLNAQPFPQEHFNKIYNLDFDTGLSLSENPYSILADNQEDFLYLILTDNDEIFRSMLKRESLRKKRIEGSLADEYIKEYCTAEIELQ